MAVLVPRTLDVLRMLVDDLQPFGAHALQMLSVLVDHVELLRLLEETAQRCVGDVGGSVEVSVRYHRHEDQQQRGDRAEDERIADGELLNNGALREENAIRAVLLGKFPYLTERDISGWVAIVCRLVTNTMHMAITGAGFTVLRNMDSQPSSNATANRDI